MKQTASLSLSLILVSFSLLSLLLFLLFFSLKLDFYAQLSEEPAHYSAKIKKFASAVSTLGSRL